MERSSFETKAIFAYQLQTDTSKYHLTSIEQFERSQLSFSFDRKWWDDSVVILRQIQVSLSAEAVKRFQKEFQHKTYWGNCARIVIVYEEISRKRKARTKSTRERWWNLKGLAKGSYRSHRRLYSESLYRFVPFPSAH